MELKIKLQKLSFTKEILKEYIRFTNTLKEPEEGLLLLDYRLNDYAINLLLSEKLKTKPIYFLSNKKLQVLKQHINKNLARKYIKHSLLNIN